MTRSLPVLFACVPLGTRLTRRACGMRHLEAKIASKGNKLVVRDETCRTCVVGEKHASGLEPSSWPDGAPITTAAPSAAQPPGKPEAKPINLDAPVRAKRAVPVPAPKETSMPKPRPITFQGRTQSVSDWAREVGMTPQAISSRIKLAMEKGLDENVAVASALTKPRDPKQPTTRGIEPSTRAARKKSGLPPLKLAADAVERLRKEVVALTIKKAYEPKTSAALSDSLPPAGAQQDAAAPLPRGVQQLESLITAAGYKISSFGPVPAGFAFIVEAP